MRIYAYVKGGQFVPHLARRRLLAARANVKDEPRRAKTSADRAARQQLRDLAKQWRELAAMVENYEKTVHQSPGRITSTVLPSTAMRMVKNHTNSPRRAVNPYLFPRSRIPIWLSKAV